MPRANVFDMFKDKYSCPNAHTPHPPNQNNNPNQSSKMRFSQFARHYSRANVYNYTPECKAPNQFITSSCNPADVQPIPPNPYCLSQTFNNIYFIQDGNITFNAIPYPDFTHIGVRTGQYTIQNAPEQYAIGFGIRNDDLFEVIAGAPHGSPVEVGNEQIFVQHYKGDITFEVKGDFGVISYHFYNNGYLGGQNRLIYSDSLCT